MARPEAIIPPLYVGDGVYASFDGYHIWLTTERDGLIHTIAVEPSVMSALVNFANRVWKKPSVEGSAE